LAGDHASDLRGIFSCKTFSADGDPFGARIELAALSNAEQLGICSLSLRLALTVKTEAGSLFYSVAKMLMDAAASRQNHPGCGAGSVSAKQISLQARCLLATQAGSLCYELI
jgi:hypothetical protein